ncbi:Fe-S-containing protein [Rhodobium gokarnense]|uniref:Membrane protein/YHS domain-containing protein n=1 Tax=Rhodobium gokarnense TaxID=364296 RepID=A0ABT3HGR1_9HYPH|nr:Fe-S-containing protein [Rhodobium gokarnense]MCW2309579.1 putative membrane protein/YHS domain-containing protein [Rhodobium gokarnense]
MIVYLTNIAGAFLPAALLTGILVALAPGETKRRDVVVAAWTVAAALAAGWLAYSLAASNGVEVRAKTVIRIVAIAALVLALLLAALSFRLTGRRRAWFVAAVAGVAAVLAFQGMFDVLAGTADRSFTATAVLNTELIANSAAVALGAVLIAALTVFVAHMGRRVIRTAAGILVVAVLGLAATWGAEVMLGALQMGLLEVTSGRVSFVAKATQYGGATGYGALILLALLAAAFFLARPSGDDGINAANDGRAERRKRRAFALGEARWLRATLAVGTFLTATLLYYDLYASLPPTLSKAEAAVPNDDGVVRVPIDSVKDGKLYRFAYIASDGHRVRFFLINRYDEDHVKIGVVYDACMICGDDGYIQDGNDVICIACNVRVFVPSIGKAGGCNPIPLEHSEDGGDIVIAARELERGAKYFSEVVAITVTDPVTGKELINLDAPYRYDFKGNTFFFESQDSYDAFKAEPEKYAGEVEGRLYRVQGHQTKG